MKVGDGGETFFVFETEGSVPSYLVTSPVISPASSPRSSPRSRSGSASDSDLPGSDTEPDFLDLETSRSRSSSPTPANVPRSANIDIPRKSSTPPTTRQPYMGGQQFAESLPNITRSRSPTLTREQAMERAQQLTKKLKTININTKVTDNGDVVMDMTGYKSGKAEVEESEEVVKRILAEEFGETNLDELMKRDPEGHLRIFAPVEDGILDYGSDDGGSDENMPTTPSGSPPKPTHAATFPTTASELSDAEEAANEKVYAKTLRLTSDQLKSLNLNPGCNDVSFTVLESKAQCTARMFYWKYDVPIVISDIDGTITKSDALGHVLAMIGRDWTHPGVGKLFTDIESNGYHVMYLTARSVGQADSTRYYLKGISQDGYKLPEGPVILSPDRTMAALRREVIMKKPEVFKMACLKDIKNLYGDLDETPFYAGFGNRITDALSYRSVGVPSSRIFTINPNGDVHLELLELSGYKSSYVSISDLVDHFFPPAGYFRGQETYTDLAYWREPIPELSDLDSDEDNDNGNLDGSRSPKQAALGSHSAANGSSISIPGSPKQEPMRGSLLGSPPSTFIDSKPLIAAKNSNASEPKHANELASDLSFPNARGAAFGRGERLVLEEKLSSDLELDAKKDRLTKEGSSDEENSAGFSGSDEFEEDGEYDDEEEGDEEDSLYSGSDSDEDKESQIGHGEYESEEEDDDEDKESQIGHGEYESDDEEMSEDTDSLKGDNENSSIVSDIEAHESQFNQLKKVNT